jgi:lysophospholipase L1-like esterase
MLLAIAGLFWGATAEAGCDPVDLTLTTTPVMPQLNYALHRHYDLMSELPSGPVDLLLIGDSLVESWDRMSWGEAGKSKTIFDFGVGGDRTQTLLWRLQNDRLAELRPRNVLLLIGTNNLAVDDRPCAVLAGIDSVVRQMRWLWGDFRLLVVPIPPRGEHWKFQDAQRKEINEGLLNRATAAGWTTIDMDAALTCNFTQPCPNYQWDNLHLAPPGYRALTAATVAKLRW